MSRVDVILNGRAYALACEDGQENRLRELAAYVDARLTEVATASAGGSEAQHLVLASLVLADEVQELREEVAGLKSRAATAPPPPPPGPDPGLLEENVVNAVDTLARRIEDIAQRLERA